MVLSFGWNDGRSEAVFNSGGLCLKNPLKILYPYSPGSFSGMNSVLFQDLPGGDKHLPYLQDVCVQVF